MKKLLVLAAVAAMAMGVQAESTFVLNIPGARSAYSVGVDGIKGEPNGYDDYKLIWSMYKPMFTDAAGYDEILGTGFPATTWTERYAAISTYLFSELNKTSPGNFEYIADGTVYSEDYFSEIMVVAILDSDEMSPGAEYVVYYGQTKPADWPADAIGFDELKVIDSGNLMTDAAPVPEPTSGLLMLLGVAGLALRRRRA